jgi:uncharacterized protein (DUF305 family)
VLGILLVLIGLGGMVVAGAFQQRADVGSLAPSINEPGGTSGQTAVSGGRVDAMFIQEMIPHHDGAIAMADLALTKAEHPEIKQLAENIKRTQTAENVQMRLWYREWFDSEVPASSEGSFGMMGSMMGGDDTDLAALTSADSFDKAFIEQMIPHHQMGIMMSQMMGSATGSTEMREFAQSIIDAQSNEIDQMRAWYQEWYR